MEIEAQIVVNQLGLSMSFERDTSALGDTRQEGIVLSGGMSRNVSHESQQRNVVALRDKLGQTK